MKKRPLFPKHATNVSQTDYQRNIWCPFYSFCQAEALRRHCFLSCSLCGFKFSRMINGALV